MRSVAGLLLLALFLHLLVAVFGGVLSERDGAEGDAEAECDYQKSFHVSP